ncbi:Peptidase family M3 [Seminavis robusta]|uniref:Peptidase family M3 n=1 Tax=Seminavis robusta TaxID=568900 RepID=A0A9N8DPI3_9STRA|nr:Peptidase family M3 [Seminavis robusta]|eukprot:Sro278_g106490.1 Peptidase family M3 (641) ;mRNA; r:10058-12376
MTTNPQEIAAQAFVDDFNKEYEAKHLAFEKQFWGNKMALSSTPEDTYSSDLLSSTKAEMENLLSDPTVLQRAQEFRNNLIMAEKKDTPPEDNLMKTLDIIIKTCKCYDMSSAPEARKLREDTSKLESSLELARNRSLTLGYTLLDGTFQETSSVGLRNVMKTHQEEAVRKSAYDALRSIGPFCLGHGFVEIIKLRNRMAKSLGFQDYYDYKVTNSEGFGKDKLFQILDTLEQGTRPIMEKARTELERRFGKEALEPWNTGFMISGTAQARMDTYFPFGKAVERYVRSYAAMGISYEGSVMNLDLLERKNKHDNGFCHWPAVAWVKPDGSFQPATTNFTSCADPKAVGSGLAALTVLCHEAGHAAHFANVKQPSPLFSQERAPTSVPYAENQSMFLDSLVGDAAWRAVYARNDKNEPIPFDLIEEEVRSNHPFAVFQLRGMLSVSYFEKALYELPEEEVTADKIKELADETELKIQGGYSIRPILAYPHIISDEASCYYHGYTLAEMSVHQTRCFFKERDGFIVDNPKVGPTLTEAYWRCGNSRAFLEIVKDLTGKELAGESWVDALKESVDDKVQRERREYDEALAKAESQTTVVNDDLNAILNMTIRFVDGDTLIADSSKVEGGILGACQAFETFVEAR